jgi:hypothetical protein
MADQLRPDNLAPIYARLAAQDAEIARLRHRRRLPRRALPLLLAVLLVALVPLAALAANPFIDLVPGSVHNANIDAIYNAGITTGCDPHVAYCPTDFVTRQEMASFLARTAGVGGNPPVANARTAVDASTALNAATAQLAGQPIANAVNAQSAGNASTVGGLAPNGLVRVAREARSESVPLGTTPTTVLELQIVTPGAGFVLVTGVTNLRSFAAVEEGQVTLRDAGGAQVSPVSFAALGSTVGRAVLQPVAVTWVFTVPAAGPATYLLQAQRFAGTSMDALSTTMTALYIPFGASGSATLADVAPPPTNPGPETLP